MLLIFAAGAVSVSLPHGHASPEKGRPCPRHILSYVLYEFAAFCRRKEITGVAGICEGEEIPLRAGLDVFMPGTGPVTVKPAPGPRDTFAPSGMPVASGRDPFCWPLPFRLTKACEREEERSTVASSACGLRGTDLMVTERMPVPRRTVWARSREMFYVKHGGAAKGRGRLHGHFPVPCYFFVSYTVPVLISASYIFLYVRMLYFRI